MPEDRESSTAMRTRLSGPHADRALGEIAARQHGVVARRQLITAGFTSSFVNRHIASGHLVSIYRAVYAVGHDRLRREGHWLAAVLAAGPEAVLSHRDAASLHEIRFSRGMHVEVSTAAERRSPRGIRIHARRALDAADITTVDGIRATTVARTIVDLADVLAHEQLSKALSEADRRGKLDVRALEAALHRTRGRRGPGHARLRAVLQEHAALGATLTRSELEDRFVTLLDAHRIPRPRLNAWIPEAGGEVDALWPAERLVVELDGYAFHSNRRTFQRDREKGNDLVDLGYRVLRFTHRDVVRGGAAVVERLRRALAVDLAARSEHLPSAHSPARAAAAAGLCYPSA